MECFRRAHLVGQNPELRLAELAQANKLVRSYAALAETLERRRRPPEQVVRVERVTVASGGQAIVGNVSHPGAGGRGDGAESEEQPHAPGDRAHEPGAAVRGADPEREPVPVAGGKGQDALPDARRSR